MRKQSGIQTPPQVTISVGTLSAKLSTPGEVAIWAFPPATGRVRKGQSRSLILVAAKTFNRNSGVAPLASVEISRLTSTLDVHRNMNLWLVARTDNGIYGTHWSGTQEGRGVTHVLASGWRRLPVSSKSMREWSSVQCRDYAYRDLGVRTALVGMHYSTTRSWDHTFTLTIGQSTTFGVGFSQSGAIGSWEANGTSTKSTTDVTDFPHSVGRRHDYTYYSWYEYKYICDGILFGYHAKPVAHEGGTVTYAPSTSNIPSARLCLPYARGSKKTTLDESDVAYTAGGGANLLDVLGINFSTLTGYSSKAKVEFIANGSGLSLCGTNAYPARAGTRRLVGKLTSET